MTANLVRAIDAATQLGMSASVLYAMVDGGEVQGHRREDRLWVDLTEARSALAARAELPFAP